MTKKAKKNSAKNAVRKNQKVGEPAQLVYLRARTWSVALVLLCMPAALIWQLAHLQILPNEEKGYAFLQQQGEARTLREEKLNAYRGVITDRHGELLAVSTPVLSIVANPQRLDHSQLDVLADALNVSVKSLALKVSRYAGKQFMYVARHLPPHQAQNILDLNIEGIRAEEEFQRYYPAAEVAAHVVGFTDIDEHGREGMELALNDWLSGAPGYKQVIKDLKGNVVKDLGIKQAASSGNDVRLTLDLRLQYLAYRELKSSIAEQGAKSGSIVVMDVDTGEILAMANQPSYNPNNRSNLHADQLRNRAVTDIIEPGSTMKPFTVLAALESGRYYPATRINTNPGYIRVANKTYTDFKNYGVLNLTEILQKSSQVGISKISLDLDVQNLRDVFFRVGFGQSTGTGFPGESVGLLPNRTKWHPTEHAALGFGHGLSVTPLQLAQAYVALASDGIFKPATLLPRGDNTIDTQRVMSAKHARQIIKMMSQVTERGGTATRAHLGAYTVAGKTGTAHKVGGQGYVDDKYVALFAGIVPADKPELVVAVVINEPPNQRYFGGEAAAPVFRRFAESAMQLLHVPPQQRVSQKVAAK